MSLSAYYIVSFAAVIRLVTQRFSPTKRCVMTLITAAKETTLYFMTHCKTHKSVKTEKAIFRRFYLFTKIEWGNSNSASTYFHASF